MPETTASVVPHQSLDAVEARFLSSVSLDAPWSLVERFSTSPRWRPDDVNAAAEEIATRLRALGVPVEIHAPSMFLSIPMAASVESDGQTFEGKPPSSSPSCPEGVTGRLAYIPANPKALRSYSKNVAELFGRPESDLATLTEQLRGAIVITEGFGNPALTQLVEEWGGIGLIAINPGVDTHWGTCTTVWGSPDLDDLPRRPRIPVIAVSREKGESLKRIAGEGGAATLKTTLEEGWFEQKVPVVDIPGATEPGKFVLVHGHYDSWDVGVGDNATGDATLLELARVFWRERAHLRRSVRLAWWPGHSTGRYAGSTWFADHFAIDLDENCVAQINCDSPGCRWATSFHQTTTMAETATLVRDAIETFAPGSFKAKRPNQAGDYSFNNIGISSFYMLSSTMPDALRAEKGYYDVSGCGGNIAWHTENDTLEIADREMLLRDMRIYLLSALRIANAEVLPFDWRATVAEFLDTIGRYQAAAGDRFDLTPSRDAAEALDVALGRLSAVARSGSASPTRVNPLLQRLARILVTINFTREPRFRHDPAFTVPPLPTIAIVAELAAIEPERMGFALTQAVRGQNRLVAALREATRLVESALQA